MEKNASPIGQRIRAARERAGLSQERLGQLAHLSGMTIYRYERGAFCPGGEALAALADALGVRMRWLITGDGPEHDAPAATGTDGD